MKSSRKTDVAEFRLTTELIDGSDYSQLSKEWDDQEYKKSYQASLYIALYRAGNPNHVDGQAVSR